MEKKPQYHATTQKDVEQFLKPKKDNKHYQAKAFQVIEPIETAIGPVGKFIVEPDSFPKDFSMAAFGKRRSGKTFTYDWIAYNVLRHIPFGLCFTRTKINGFWQTRIPSKFVIQGLVHHKLLALVKRQKKMIADWKRNNPKLAEADPDAYREVPELKAFCILDDVIADRVEMQWNTEINSFFVEGRHLCITVLITTQHIKGIGPMLRGNLDIAVIMPVFQHDAREELQKLFGATYEKKIFFQMMNEIVMDEEEEDSTPLEPHKQVRSLIVNDYLNTPDPQMKYKWLIAEKPPDYKLLDPAYWKEDESALDKNLSVDNADPVDQLDELLSVYSFTN